MIEGHGDDAYKYGKRIKADFSSNIYSHASLTDVKHHLSQKLHLIAHYPEPEPYRLSSLLAAQLHLNEEQIMVTAGATDAIYLIAQAFSGKTSAIEIPAFSEYHDACLANGHHIVSLPSWTCSESRYLYRSHLEQLSEPSSAPFDLYWICNPNNPTGQVISHSLILDSIRQWPHLCFVIDQSYEDFTTKPLLSPTAAAEASNVLQIHSLTKKYAIPGLRLGYVVGNAQLIAMLKAYQKPWNINTLAIEAGMYLLQHPAERHPQLTEYHRNTRRFQERLSQIEGCHVSPSDMHFFLFTFGGLSSAQLKQLLVERYGLLVRANLPQFDPQAVRVATQDHDENDLLVEALQQLIHHDA